MADLFNTLTDTKPVLRTACSKCNLPLEVGERQKIGLGKDCEENVKKVFDSTIKQSNGVGQDSWFNFMTLINGIDGDSIVPEVNDILKRLSLNIVSMTSGGMMAKPDSTDLVPVPFNIILDAFSISRNCTPQLKELIEKALIEMGFAQMVALATGDFCLGTASVHFDPEEKRFLCAMSIRRSAAEVFNLIEGAQRPSKMFWTIPQRSGQIMIDTLKLRFPLPGTLTVSPEAFAAIADIPNLPAEDEKPAIFRTKEMDRVLFELDKMDKNGNYHFTKRSYPLIFPWFTDKNGINASYDRDGSTEKKFSFIVRRDQLEAIANFVNNLERNEPKAPKKGKK